jgi:predicted amidohydrolase YtcJ
LGYSVAQAAGETAQTVLVNGAVVTMDDAQPNAAAIAWLDGRIIAVGSNEQIRERIGAGTDVIDAQGQLVIPGFIESHGHFSSMGLAKMNLELRDADSWEEIVAQVAQAAKSAPAGQWIKGRGWHQEKWRVPLEEQVEGYPTHQKLTEAAPNHPVFLTHASGHMAIANAQAMKLARIDKQTPDPSGGEILRNADGDTTGVLRETATELVSKIVDRASEDPAAWQRAIQLAGEECVRHGVTSFHDAGSDFEEIDRYRFAANRGDLLVRLWIMVRDDPDAMKQRLAKYRIVNEADRFLTVRAIKQSLDGALGAHGAWLKEPYDDLPTSTGLNTLPLNELEQVATLAAENDFQLCVHAIGDRANHEVLNLYEQTFATHPTTESRRWRIEHAQHLNREDISRFGELGVIAAMQGVHCTSDAVFVGLRLGQRRAGQGAYRWRDLLDAGAVIANGTDAPVEDVNPINSFYASVTRKTKSGVAFYPEQAMTRAEALRSYTLAAAYAAFEEQEKGSLTVGKMADITVLTKNIMTCSEETICDAKVALTIINGKIAYRQ